MKATSSAPVRARCCIDSACQHITLGLIPIYSHACSFSSLATFFFSFLATLHRLVLPKKIVVHFDDAAGLNLYRVTV